MKKKAKTKPKKRLIMEVSKKDGSTLSGEALTGISPVEKSTHGGSRENSGRNAELRRPRRILLNLEKEHVLFLDGIAKKKKLRGRSAAAREILEKLVIKEMKKQSRLGAILRSLG